MGILKLMDFIKTKFPAAILLKKPEQYRNTTLAIDSSNWIYQFLVKTIMQGNNSITTPTDWQGNQTGHLIGIMARSAYCLENGILPVWVFDGKPPKEKFTQLSRRNKNKQLAEEKMETAIEEEQPFTLLKQAQRSVRISGTQTSDAKQLIRLLGLPVIQSPSQAQPQCGQLVKSGLVYATISQDMDTLAFGCPRMIRYFKQKQESFSEIHLDNLLNLTKLTYDQFVDFCILCGCDYSSKISNIGPVKAYNFIRVYGNIDTILQEIAKDQKLREKHFYDDQFNYFSARKVFKSPQVAKVQKQQIQFRPLQQNQLKQFLKSKQFSQTRIDNFLKKVYATGFYSS